MKAALTELRRKTAEIVQPVMAGKSKLVVTEHGPPWLEISKAAKITEIARTWSRLKYSPEVKRPPQALWDSLMMQWP